MLLRHHWIHRRKAHSTVCFCSNQTRVWKKILKYWEKWWKGYIKKDVELWNSRDWTKAHSEIKIQWGIKKLFQRIVLKKKLRRILEIMAHQYHGDIYAQERHSHKVKNIVKSSHGSPDFSLDPLTSSRIILINNHW